MQTVRERTLRKPALHAFSTSRLATPNVIPPLQHGTLQQLPLLLYYMKKKFTPFRNVPMPINARRECPQYPPTRR